MRLSRYFGILSVMMLGLLCGTAFNSYALSRAAYKNLVDATEALKLPNATMGISAVEPNLTVAQSKGLTVFAYTSHRIAREKKIVSVQIFMFSQDQDGFDFAKYQRARSYAPLTKENYSELASLWKNVPVCGVFTRKKYKVEWFYPQQNPSGWWKPLFAPRNPAPKTQPPAPK